MSMDASINRSLTRKELYDLVWSTPMRVLAPQFNLSDVGLAKVCRKHGIPRPSPGYWARIQHGQKPKKPPLPAAPANTADVIQFARRATIVKQEDEAFLDADLAALAARIEQGELVASVAPTLHGCSKVTARTRESLAFKARAPKRDQWGFLQETHRYEGSHVAVVVAKDLQRRALLLLDAAVKTLETIGCQVIEPTDRWNRIVAFELKGEKLGIRISERSRQIAHVLTDSEKEQQRRTGRHWGPKHDHVPTQELRLDLTYAHNGSAWSRFKDGKKRKVEGALSQFALAVLRRADDGLKRVARERERARLAAERERIEREQAETRRREEALRRVEAEQRNRLLDLAISWRKHSELVSFLSECRRRMTELKLSAEDFERIERWMSWADEVAMLVDPFGHGLLALPAMTNPGQRE
jgi:hypothetical protein